MQPFHTTAMETGCLLFCIVRIFRPYVVGCPTMHHKKKCTTYGHYVVFSDMVICYQIYNSQTTTCHLHENTICLTVALCVPHYYVCCRQCWECYKQGSWSSLTYEVKYTLDSLLKGHTSNTDIHTYIQSVGNMGGTENPHRDRRCKLCTERPWMTYIFNLGIFFCEVTLLSTAPHFYL